jgi:uncharacterized protein YbjT (DUF2867 family)
MAESKVIAVVGSTGAQGGGLVRAISADPDSGFTARAITRDPDSDAAKALAALPNVELVKADLEDPPSVEAAFAGAYGAFCVTFFWVDFSPEHEMAQARNMAAAAKAAGVRHVIWSTLEDTRRFVTDDRMPTLQGRYKVPHFDGKEEADAAFREARVPTTFLRTAFYWENFIYFGLGPVRGEDGVLALTFPMGSSRLPGMAAEDIGKTAYGIFARGDELIGKTISIAGEHLTGAEIAEKMGRAIGEEVRYNAVDADVFRSFGFPGADEVGNMFQFKRDFEAEYVGPRDLEYARTLNPQLQDFDAWLGANAGRIPLG